MSKQKKSTTKKKQNKQTGFKNDLINFSDKYKENSNAHE